VPGNAVKWISCPDVKTLGVVQSLSIIGCESTPVCTLIKGKNASLEIDFTTTENSNAGTSVVHGIIAGIRVPFALSNPDVCKDSGVSCPLQTGTTYKYMTQIFVKTIYPSIKLKVQWEIQDDAGKDLICIELPAQISDSSAGFKSLGASSRLRFASKHL